ncbi:hypothetical protein [Methylobacterium fujisawaense]|uniref:hypothetical protein n=1 Tax=Methylobacterium fujisawaense TaxID=107400 RepID=UPI00313E3415
MGRPARLPTITERTARVQADRHLTLAYDCLCNAVLASGTTLKADTGRNAGDLRGILDAAITNLVVARARLDDRAGG